MAPVTMQTLRQLWASSRVQAMVEAAIVASILIWAGNWGTWYWNQSLALGRHPFFYQLYYEPAVMVACGKGFVVAQPQVPAMTKFLTEQTAEFDCKDIPADAKLGTDGLYQGSARYIMTTVGWTWRIVGVSWRRLGPVAGVLFGMTIAAAYGIFRLGMGRVIAMVLAWVLSLSTLHLANLPNIRDYSKAPFALILIFLLGLLVTHRPSWKRVVGISVAYGVVMGIGYGFRTDLLINIPAFLLTVFLFLDANVRKRLAFGAVAAAVCMTTFYVSAWPIISAVNRTWGCQWHTAILGLGDDNTHDLQLEATPYDWLDGYTDEFAFATATSYAARLEPGVKHIEYCGPDYDRVTSAFMLDIARHAPADFIVRAYASSLQMVQLPLRWRKPPIPHMATDFYRMRMAMTAHAQDAGIVLVAVAVFLVAAANIRLGIFLIGFLLYFGGYPAVQFGNRHFFHLEFITWWAFGFLLQQVVTAIVARARKQPHPAFAPGAVRRASLVLGGSVVALWAVLAVARLYQQSALEPLMEQYTNAQLDQVFSDDTAAKVFRVPPAAAKRTDPETADLLEVDLNEWQCPADSKLKFVYDSSHQGFARDLIVKTGAARVPTRMFIPVYATFQGVSIGDAPPGCLAGVYRVQHPERFTLMPKLLLRPGWEDQPLYQSLHGWGIEPPPDE